MRNVDTDVLLSAFHRAWQRYTETSATVDLVRLSECIKAQGSTPAAEAALAAAYETLFLADERFRIRPICCFFEHKLHLYADDEELFAAWLEVACRLARIGNSDIRNSLIFWAFHRNRLRWRMKSGRAYTLLAPGARELRGELLPSLDREELIYAVRLCLDAASNKLNEDDFIIDDFLSFACVDPALASQLYCAYFARSSLDDARHIHVRELLVSWWRSQTNRPHVRELERPFEELTRGTTNEDMNRMFGLSRT